MADKITILAAQGCPDSLKRDVNIVFTLTPTETYLSRPTYRPVAFAAMTFSSHSESSETFSWERELVFATYDVKYDNGNKKCVSRTDRSAVVPAGHYAVLQGSPLEWGQPIKFPRDDFSIALIGGSAQSLSTVKYITLGGVRAQLPIIAWSPTVHVYFGPSPNLVLQAYMVKAAGLDGAILETSDLNHPLFPEPLTTNALQESPAWSLTEDDSGKISLKKTDMINMANRRKVVKSLDQDVQTLTKSFDIMKDQLATLVKSLDDTHQRLAMVEKSVGTSQTELREVQRTLATTRDEMSRLDHRMPEVANIATSLDRTNERIAAVETSATKLQGEVKALDSTRGDLKWLGVSVQGIQQQVSSVTTSIGTIVDHRLPTVESKLNDLDESLGHVQDQQSAARTAAGTTRDRVDRLNRGVLAVQATVDTLGASVGQDQDRLSAMEESTGHVRERLDAAEKQIVSIPDSVGLPRTVDNSTVNDESLTTIRRQMVALNRRFPTIEVRIEKVEKYVTIMERKIPTVEEKAIRAKRLSEKTQDGLGALELSLVTTEHELGFLGSRVAEIEVKMSGLAAPSDQDEPPSPGVFPSQSPLDPL